MPVPLFIIYELLIRIHQFDPCIGTYVSHKFNSTGAVITTSTRTLKVRNAILNRQFRDPKLITPEDLQKLL